MAAKYQTHPKGEPPALHLLSDGQRGGEAPEPVSELITMADAVFLLQDPPFNFAVSSTR